MSETYVCAHCGKQFEDGEKRDDHFMSSDCPRQIRYLTRQSKGIEILKENPHDEIYRHADGQRGAESWKLDVGLELNTLQDLAHRLENDLPMTEANHIEFAETIRSIVERVADLEELETE